MLDFHGTCPRVLEKHLNVEIEDIKGSIPRLEEKIAQKEKDLEYYKSRLGETFPKEEEYQKADERLQELEAVYVGLKAKKEEEKVAKKHKGKVR